MAAPDPNLPKSSRWPAGAFGLTILVSAFLLFQVQPLVSKAILPWFGGCPAVWTTCMLFFQTLLFGGYLYAHLLQRWLAPRSQVAVHLLIVLAAVALLPILPSASSKPVDSSYPTWHILTLLTVAVGLPYFALSGTSPLVQAWFSVRYPGRSPYRLYALSNFGSLAALLTYPFVFEPALDLPRQSSLWSTAFAVYAALCAACLACLWRTRAIQGGPAVSATDSQVAPTWLRRFCWLALPAGASLMLLAATNHICQDVATVPFLWVMPLSLYLLSFIICFDHERWYVRRFWSAAVIVALTGVVANEYLRQDHPLQLMPELLLNFAALFFTCMMCHGELARLKPSPRYLTEFYLMIAAGGAFGGLLVAVVAPNVFNGYLEWQFGVVAAALLAFGLVVLPRHAGRRGITCYAVAAPLLALLASWTFYWGFESSPSVDRVRNFFGVVIVRNYGPTPSEPAQRLLVHGRITHGCQAIEPDKRHWITSYYAEQSGVGQAIRHLQKSGPIRVGAIGLGIGTVAAYARPGDVFRFYEINPEVPRLAKKHFTYLADCRGTYDIVLGDARLSLESEPPQKFDVLIVDAFSGDAIPTHLLTAEAFEVYRRHLAPDGILAVHVSNTYLRLAPVVRALAEHCGMQCVEIANSGDNERMINGSDWMLVKQNDAFLAAHPQEKSDAADEDLVVPLWTDQYSNLFQILSGGIGRFWR